MKLLLYSCKAKPYLSFYRGCCRDEYVLDNEDRGRILNGKIVAECDFEVEEIEYEWYPCNILPIGEHYYTYYHTKSILTAKEFYSKSCLDWDKLNQYLNDYDSQKFDVGYAIHIKNLHIFNEPRELNDYYETKDMHSNEDHNWYNFGYHYIDTAPKNMRLVSDKDNGNGNKFIMISIKPDELCRVLNDEQTIIVRKKVLKEMTE